MDYLLDTNIIVHLVRGSRLAYQIEEQLNLLGVDTKIYISAVTKGELLSFAKRNHWGNTKTQQLALLLEQLKSVPIDGSSPIMEAYADIDAFSQGKHPEYQLPSGVSARNMGKNDLWIASTAYLLDVKLVTTDHDFDHLTPYFFDVVKF
jgi:tRNA(fMet)-specific endonuclease VapC